MIAVIALAALGGCNGCIPPAGPANLPVARITGIVTLLGRPLPANARGWVSAYPTDGARGDAATTRMGADGRYVIDGAPAGPVQIRIELAPATAAALPPNVRSRIAGYRGPSSPLKAKTEAKETARVDVDLALGAG